MKLARRNFLKGVAGAYLASHIPTDIYGLSDIETGLIFPTNPAPWSFFQVQVHGNWAQTWPSNVVWANARDPVPSGRTDLLHFVRGEKGEWFGSIIGDLK